MAAATTLLQGGTVLYHGRKDNVEVLRNTDILIQANKIVKIGQKLSAPSGAAITDCRGKIISPGFIDTHHHLWQTQLKGRHAEQSVFDYIPSGFWQSYVYSPQDIFWGQLGGALESIDAGTTFVLDHAHGCQTREHVTKALAATCASGIRSIFAYGHAPYFTKWDKDTCEPSMDIMPKSTMDHLFELAAKQPFGHGRVTLGFAFDYYFLPQQAVTGIFEALRNAGVKNFTSHYAKNATFGQHPLINTLNAYGLIKSPSDILLSHATGLTAQETDLLVSSQVPVSSTPETESQMGFGWPIAFHPGVNFSFGVDCHTNNTSSILGLARSALQMARQQGNLPNVEQGAMALTLRGSAEEAFNAATIRAARAVQLGDKIGSLAEGKLADLVVFDTLHSTGMSCVADSDPLTAVVRHSDVRDVEAVMIDGVWRKKDGKLRPVTVEGTNETLEWSHVRTKLRDSAGQIAEKQKGLNMDKAKEALIAMFRIDRSKLVKDA
ncbi:hypothetical protein Z517_03278 [Fonsecaea pedrosoi CBS 271.37]|uniref:Amidohydrolase-related domain-containing protein n=1 Tax=Fonsecaea pedrosoi CBS 271.37 TaxID=1442368 RepID=A0A0D2FBP8_9EURO|nr:uncharacterized protein Z517_03278 [Fonsecaea pedrosoi CBS 271.37]KIW84032.1 hypothetical protein Z517_03278 [Fonsecaea pedrosoi CBS 271.37]